MKITFVPEDKDLFKDKIIATKHARRIVEYLDGTVQEFSWNVKRFSKTSNLMGNITTQSWYKRDKANIKQVVIVACDKSGADFELPMQNNVKKGPEQEPIMSLSKGKDSETELISYDNVPEEEQVPELCCNLENVYESILNFACQIFGDRAYPLQLRRIPVILKQNCPSRIYFHNDEYVMKKINERVKNGENVDILETRRIMRHTMRICGMFVDKPRPHIEIFFNQFDALCMDEYIAKIGNTLAHEYMHYLEYELCRYYGKKAFTDDNVSEALADFYGVLYSIKRGGKYDLSVAENKHHLWKELEGSGWPYAYALYFYKVGGNEMRFSTNYADYVKHRSVNKLVEVFKATPNPEDAYDKLTKL